MVASMKNWERAEIEFCNLLHDVYNVGASVTKDLELQYKDIDVIYVANNKDFSVSVKEQNSVEKYKTLLFEYLLVDTNDFSSMQGNVITCGADYYAIKYKQNGVDYFLVVKTKELKGLLLGGVWETKSTTKHTEQLNKSQGRKYNRTLNWKVPIDSVLNLNGVFVFKYEQNKWSLYGKS